MGTIFPGDCCGNGYYQVAVGSGGAAEANTTSPAGGNVVDVTVPNSAAASTAVTLTIYNVTNAATTGNLNVSTSSDPTSSSKPLGLTSTSSVSGLTVGLSSQAGGAEGVTYTVGFTTSSSGSLTGGWSKIILQAPVGTIFPGDCCGNGYYQVAVGSGGAAEANTTSPAGGNVVDVTVPNSAAASTAVTLTIYNVTNAATTGNLNVSTSSDPTSSSKPLGLTSTSSVSGLTVGLSSQAGGAEGVTYTVGFTTSSSGSLTGGWSKIILQAPVGTIFPGDCCGNYSVSVAGGSAAGTSATIPAGGNVVDVVVPNNATASTAVSLTIHGVTNPGGGEFPFIASTSSDSTGNPYELTFTGAPISAASVTDVAVTPSSTSVGATGVTDKITFTATSAVSASSGAIVLSAPFGTQFDTNDTDYAVADTTAGWSLPYNTGSLVFAEGGATVSFNPPQTINAGDAITLEISGIRNAQSTGGSLSVSTTADPVPVSASLGLAAATAVTDVAVTPSSTSVGATGVTDKITFTATSQVPVNVEDPSRSGAIVLSAPFGTQFDTNDTDYAVADTTAGWSLPYNTGSLVFAEGGATVSFNPPQTINAGDAITLEISGIRNAQSTGGSLSVSTTADPVPVSASLGLGAATAVTDVAVTPSSTSVGATGVTDKITFTATSQVPVNVEDPSRSGAIVLSAPFGTQFDTNDTDYAVADTTAGWSLPYNTGSLVFAEGGATVSFNPPQTINAGDAITLEISGIRNAQSTGGSLSVSTTADPVPVSASLGLAAATAVTDVAVTPSSTSVGATGVTDKITFTATSQVPVNVEDPSRSGAIVLSAPFGTQFDTNDTDYAVADTTAGWSLPYNTGSLVFAEGGATVSFNPPQTINAGDAITLEISGIGRVAAGPIAISTTADPIPDSSGALGLPSAPSHVKAVNAGNNAATVTWSPAGAPGTPIESYVVTVATGPNADQQLAVVGTTTAATLTGLVAGKATFSVIGFDVIGAGPSATSASYTVPGSTAKSYVTTVLGNHPSLFYRLGDSAPVAMADSSGNVTPGSTETGYYNDTGNAPYGYPNDNLNVRPGALATDPNAGSVSDVGTNAAAGQVGVGGQTAPSGSSPRTVEVWMKTTVTPYYGGYGPYCFVGWGSTARDGGFDVCLSQPNQIEVSGSYDDQYFTTPTSLNDGNWHLVTVTTNGLAITVYVDGTQVGSPGAFGAQLDTPPGYPVMVGTDSSDSDGAIGFSLDDLAIYPTVLSAAQVKADYTAAGS